MSDGGGNLGGPVLIRSLVYFVSKCGEDRWRASSPLMIDKKLKSVSN